MILCGDSASCGIIRYPADRLVGTSAFGPGGLRRRMLAAWGVAATFVGKHEVVCQTDLVRLSCGCSPALAPGSRWTSGSLSKAAPAAGAFLPTQHPARGIVSRGAGWPALRPSPYPALLRLLGRSVRFLRFLSRRPGLPLAVRHTPLRVHRLLQTPGRTTRYSGSPHPRIAHIQRGRRCGTHWTGCWRVELPLSCITLWKPCLLSYPSLAMRCQPWVGIALLLRVALVLRSLSWLDYSRSWPILTGNWGRLDWAALLSTAKT